MTEPLTFSQITPSLHPLLLRSLALLSLPIPTQIQSTLIPLAISSNNDFLARASTGSGKTLAYAIPIIQSILAARDSKRASTANQLEGEEGGGTKALILVPTRELAEQVRGQIGKLIDGLGLEGEGEIRIANVAGNDGNSTNKKRKKNSAMGGERAERMHLADRPDIVVATPSRALSHLRAESLHLNHLNHLVIDEADLILSYGHSSDDIRAILSGSWGLPTSYQSFLMSATMTTEVDELKGVVLKNPVVLKIDDNESELANLSQFYVRCSEEDKFLLLYVLLKLKLIKGKCLIFVNDTDRGYRVKLFLEKFGIKAGVLNAELPFNSRYHAVQEFNRGVFDYLIATDESGLEGRDRDTIEENDEDDETAASTLISTQPTETTSEPSTSAIASTSTETLPPSKKRSRASTTTALTTPTSQPNEYGVSRGIDFVDVSCVLNFDLPMSSRSYTHRVGRTARAGRTGTSLSFVVPKDKWGGKKEVSLLSAKRDEKVWKRIVEVQGVIRGKEGMAVDEWKFEKKQVEGFRYRMEDALRSVTKVAVREARVKEIKNEVVNSEKLKAHFEDNPKDLAYLRHDKPVRPERVQQHLKHVPAYLMPRIAGVGGAASTGGSSTEGGGGELRVPFHKPGKGRGGKTAVRGGGRGGRGGRREDPLKGGKFSFGGSKTKK